MGGWNLLLELIIIDNLFLALRLSFVFPSCMIGALGDLLSLETNNSSVCKTSPFMYNHDVSICRSMSKVFIFLIGLTLLF